jgi:ornithine carbamoyltransferase
VATVVKRDFLEISDCTREELLGLLARARRLKSGEEGGRPLAGKVLCQIFKKSSTRTRVSFDVGMLQLGGHSVVLNDNDSQMGRGESTHDTARVLSSYVDGIMIRTHTHDEVLEMARHATVPVINGLTDTHHPVQVMADLQTVQEEFGAKLEAISIAWIGDGNNVANSWVEAATHLGFELRVACPEGYEPSAQLMARARSGGGNVQLLRDPLEAAEGAHVITTDVWASMGHESEMEARRAAFAGYQVTEDLMSRAAPDGIFLHCLPAHRGEEVQAEVIDGPRSRVFREAENRLHIQKSILVELLS